MTDVDHTTRADGAGLLDRLKESARRGDECDVSRDGHREFRARDIRDLLCGRAEDVHARGVRLRGAIIRGDLDLFGCQGVRIFALNECTITPDTTVTDGRTTTGSIIMDFARLHMFNLDGTTVQGCLTAIRAIVEGSVYLRYGFTAEGGVDMSGSIVRGALSCRGGTFKVGDGRADGDGVRTRAKCSRKYCLRLVDATVEGTLHLGPRERPINPRMPPAGTHDERHRKNTVDLHGDVSLEGLNVREFCDHDTTYAGLKDTQGLPRHELVLDGFVYERFGGLADTGAEYRIHQWLNLQPSEHRGRYFRPQPHEQLARVLRAMGHEEDATRIHIDRRDRIIDAQLRRLHDRGPASVRDPRSWRVGDFISHYGRRAYHQLTGAGHRIRILLALAFLWLIVGMVTAQVAASRRSIAPAQGGVMNSAWWQECRSDARTAETSLQRFAWPSARPLHDCLYGPRPELGKKAGKASTQLLCTKWDITGSTAHWPPTKEYTRGWMKE